MISILVAVALGAGSASLLFKMVEVPLTKALGLPGRNCTHHVNSEKVHAAHKPFYMQNTAQPGNFSVYGGRI